MVAYSFKTRFVDPILSGRKQQTVRAVGRRRHAWQGERLQLYTGMRTKACRLIGRATCNIVEDIRLRFGRSSGVWLGNVSILEVDRDVFAHADGFRDWAELAAFWEIEHPRAYAEGVFNGVMIAWREFTAA